MVREHCDDVSVPQGIEVDPLTFRASSADSQALAARHRRFHDTAVRKQSLPSSALALRVAFLLSVLMTSGPGYVAAAPVSWDIRTRIVQVINNRSGLLVSGGDLVDGNIQFESAASGSLLRPNYQVYDFSGNASMAVTIGGTQFVYSLTEISILNDFARPSDLIDRFFANAGDINPGGSGGIQFWLDSQGTTVTPPQLLTTLELPTMPPDLALTIQDLSGKPFVLRTSGIDLVGEIVLITPAPEPSTIPLIGAAFVGLGIVRRRRLRGRSE